MGGFLDFNGVSYNPERKLSFAHMISKYTNKNGVKLSTAIAVLAIAFLGMVVVPTSDPEAVATSTTDVEGPTSHTTSTISGELETLISETKVLEINDDTSLELKADYTISKLIIKESTKLTISSEDTMHKLTITSADGSESMIEAGNGSALIIDNAHLEIIQTSTQNSKNPIAVDGKFNLQAKDSKITIQTSATPMNGPGGQKLIYANDAGQGKGTLFNLENTTITVDSELGAQNVYWKLKNSNVTWEDKNPDSRSTVAGYFELHGSSFRARDISAYAVFLAKEQNEGSSLNATGIVQVYTKSAQISNYWTGVPTSMALGLIFVDQGCSASASVWKNWVDKDKPVKFAGTGAISGTAIADVEFTSSPETHLNVENGETFAVNSAKVTINGTLGGNGTIDFSGTTSVKMEPNSKIDASNIKINTKVPIEMGSGAEIESYSIINRTAFQVGLEIEQTPDFSDISGEDIVVVSQIGKGIDVAEAFNKFPGESLVLIGAGSNPAVSGDIILQGKKNISLYGLTYTGNVTYGTGDSAKTATFNNVVGNFSLSEGSYYITAEEIEGGTITLPDGAEADLNTDSIENLTIRMKNGTGSATLNLVVGTLGGNLDIGQGITVIQNGAIPMMVNSSVENGTSSALDVEVNGNVSLNGLFGDIAVGSNATISGTITDAENVSTKGTVTFEGALKAESLEVLSGTLTLSEGAVVNDLTVAFGAAVSVGPGRELRVDGTGEVLSAINQGYLVVSSGATVTIGKNVTVSSVENNGILVIKGTVTTLTNNKNVRLYGGIQEGTNSGTITVMDKNAEMENVSGTGSVDMSNVTETKNVSGSISAGSTSVPAYQTVIIDGDLVLKEGAYFEVMGTLVINEGVKVSVDAGAALVLKGSFAVLENNGEIVVNAGYPHTNATNTGSSVAEGLSIINTATFLNNGTTILDYTLVSTDTTHSKVVMSMSGGANLANAGSMIICDSSEMKVEGSTFVSTGDLTVEGLFTGEVSISGTVTVASNLSQSDAVIHLVSNSASAVLEKVVGVLVVDDIGFKYKPTSSANPTSVADKEQGITLTYSPVAGSSAYVGGVTVSVGTYSEMVGQTKTIHPEILLNGTVARSFIGTDTATSTQGHATLTIEGPAEVKDSLTIGTYIDVKLNGELRVSGTAVFGQNADLRKNTSDATLVTTGSVTSFVPFLTGNDEVGFVGATYSVKTAATATTAEFTTIHYTSAAAAIAAAGENADIRSIQIYSTDDGTEISSDVTVVKDLTVSIEFGKVEIASGKVMTVVDGGVLSGTTATVSVTGKLVFQNAKTGDKVGSDNITAEVIAAAGDAVTYSSLTTALVDAGEAKTVIKLQGNATIEEDTTIPSNVTVQTEGKEIVVKEEKTLTIDGTLYLNTGSINLTAEKSKVILNGYLKSDSKVDDTYSGKIAAAYYTTDDSTYHWATGIANAPSVTSVADGAVAIRGDVTVALTFVGTSDRDAEVTIKAAKVSAPITGTYAKITILEGEVTADIEVADSTLTLKSGVSLDATVKSSAGAIAAEDIKTEADSKFTAKTSDDKVTFSVSGKLADVTTDGADPALSVENDVTLTSFTYAGEISIFGNMTADKTVGLGKTVVDGSVTVANGASLTVADIDILGSLTVAEKESATASLGTFSAEKIYLGITADDLKKPATTGAAASLTAPEAIDFDVLYVAPGASVSEAIIKDAKSTTYVVDGAPFLTAYGTAKINDIAYNTDDAKFESWTDADGKEIEDSKKIGDFETISADLDYNIYKVTIIGDAGVGSVSINGIILNNDGGNRFVSEDIKAGEYKVAVSAKADYDVSEIKLVDADGKDVNMTVVLGGDVYEATYYLSGSVASSADTPSIVIPSQPAEKDDEMGITEYLLIVLVVLAAILVVVVAIRMMRS